MKKEDDYWPLSRFLLFLLSIIFITGMFIVLIVFGADMKAHDKYAPLLFALIVGAFGVMMFGKATFAWKD